MFRILHGLIHMMMVEYNNSNSIPKNDFHALYLYYVMFVHVIADVFSIILPMKFIEFRISTLFMASNNNFHEQEFFYLMYGIGPYRIGY